MAYGYLLISGSNGGLRAPMECHRGRRARSPVGLEADLGLALQLPFLTISESMGNHDSKVVDADSVD